jgi:uncharacterized protein
MKIQNDFTVEAPVEQAWETMLDLHRIAPCLPGASLEEGDGEGDEHKGTMTVKLGPVTQKYNGTVKIEEADESARRAVIHADGKDARGQGTATATIISTLEEDGNGGTKVHVETDMRVTGRAAQFGRGVQQEVATKIINKFAECLEREIMGENVQEEEPEEEAAAADQPSGDGAAQQEEKPKRRIIQQDREVEPLDLGEASRDAILKRVVPLAAGAAVLTVVFLLWRRKA